jgi:transcriptional regulator GlxA family with amidase domain
VNLERLDVGVLVFEGVELLDFAGPAEVFIVADEGRRFRVRTVGATPRVRTMGGLEVGVECSFDAAPRFDVIVVPGGDMQNVDETGLDWLRRAASQAQIVLSVCMGALLLARAGLLDDLDATTHHRGLDRLRAAAPRARVVSGPRFVDAGHIVTTAGVTAGIDGALHVVERLCGPDVANFAAREWLEHPDG